MSWQAEFVKMQRMNGTAPLQLHISKPVEKSKPTMIEMMIRTYPRIMEKTLTTRMLVSLGLAVPFGLFLNRRVRRRKNFGF